MATPTKTTKELEALLNEQRLNQAAKEEKNRIELANKKAQEKKDAIKKEEDAIIINQLITTQKLLEKLEYEKKKIKADEWTKKNEDEYNQAKNDLLILAAKLIEAWSSPKKEKKNEPPAVMYPTTPLSAETIQASWDLLKNLGITHIVNGTFDYLGTKFHFDGKNGSLIANKMSPEALTLFLQMAEVQQKQPGVTHILNALALNQPISPEIQAKLDEFEEKGIRVNFLSASEWVEYMADLMKPPITQEKRDLLEKAQVVLTTATEAQKKELYERAEEKSYSLSNMSENMKKIISEWDEATRELKTIFSEKEWASFSTEDKDAWTAEYRLLIPKDREELKTLSTEEKKTYLQEGKEAKELLQFMDDNELLTVDDKKKLENMTIKEKLIFIEEKHDNQNKFGY